MIRKRYVPDLQELAALCEANYVRFLKLLPDSEEGSERVFAITYDSENRAQVRIRVQEQHPDRKSTRLNSSHN